MKMEIKVLGTGCPKCKVLHKTVEEAVKATGVKAAVSKEEDIIKIMEYGVMATPALVIDGQVIVSGRVPSVKEVSQLIKK